MKEVKWRKMYDDFFGNNDRLLVQEDWISYQDIGFNPKNKQHLEDIKEKIKVIEIGLKKWKEEFNS